ncbi:ankyrin repeat-containing domain protein [Neocallimastix sp. 'constans']
MNIHLSKRLKTITNNQENDKYISSSEIKEIISNTKDTNMKKLKNIFNISKFYDNKNNCSLSHIPGIQPYSLVKHGVDINEEKWNSETPLFCAIKSRNRYLVKYLVEHGADINKENKEFETPLFGAINSGNKELVVYLVEHGADINKRNKYRELPYIYSINRRNYDIGNYLRKLVFRCFLYNLVISVGLSEYVEKNIEDIIKEVKEKYTNKDKKGNDILSEEADINKEKLDVNGEKYLIVGLFYFSPFNH